MPEPLSSAAAQTPLMQQYLSIKKDYPDSILFFRLGDFYEMFFEDAEIAAPLLEVQLTSRDKSSENPIPMCGIPHHAATGYIQKLIQKGMKVAICEQSEVVSHAKPGKTIIQREVARVVTPALVGDPSLVSESQRQLLMVIHAKNGAPGASLIFEAAILDLFSAEIFSGRLSSVEKLFDFILRYQPQEILVDSDQKAEEWLQKVIKTLPKALISFRAEIWEKGVLEASWAYLKENLKISTPENLFRSFPLEEDIFLKLDATTLESLEILKPRSHTGEDSSLLGNLDCCLTPMGRRTLKDWVSQPLVHLPEIEKRHDAVSSLVNNPSLYKKVEIELSQMRDLERLTTKSVLGLALPRDLVAIREILKRIPKVREALSESKASLFGDFHSQLDELQDLVLELEQSLLDDAPATLKEGYIFKETFNPEIKELRNLCGDAKAKIAAMEVREKEATGISSLKIKFSKVFGYTFEVTASHLKKVPAHYHRKQTIANGERFVTEELKSFEEKVLTAETKLKSLEEQLFVQLRKKLSSQSESLLLNAKIIGSLDCLWSFSRISKERAYQKPQMHTDWALEIKNGRHPVIETKVAPGTFIPNSVILKKESCRTLLITGPNMAGKSTIMRQVALICIMAQAGCFVPAEQAQLPVLDAVYTRIGSSDNLAQGQSTFMVEMSEMARILKQATEKSLLIIDEIGRGTSTYDGLSLAWSLLEHIHTKLQSKTLFATHFHELTQLESQYPQLRNAQVTVENKGDRILFLHHLAWGSAERSYGVEVARLAGIPVEVLERASSLLEDFECVKSEAPIQNSAQWRVSKSLEKAVLIES